MTTQFRAHAHSISAIKLHIVFVSLFRHPVITEEIELECCEIFDAICRKNDCILEQAKADLNNANDHIHLLVDLAPKVAPSKLCNTMKTVSSRKIREKYSEFLAPYYWVPRFWKRGYSIASSGGAPLEVLKKYIEEQGMHDET